MINEISSHETLKKQGPHRFLNKTGLWTLSKKEIFRFLSIPIQTIFAPAISTLLFFTIFSMAFGGIQKEIQGVSFMAFIAPGLIMMVMVQNAFINSTSSLVIAKFHGSICDILMAPLSPWDLVIGYMVGGLVRGIIVGIASALVLVAFAPLEIHSLFLVLIFALLGNMMLAGLGLITGIVADSFDHMAIVQNFIIMPLTFLSGTFYSISSLPEVWQNVALYNPFFYMIDGFRHGFIGVGDTDLFHGIIILLAMNFICIIIAYVMFRTGYKIKD